MRSSFANNLLKWHKTIHRPFPWKGEKNPYLIWLSEIILQQTRVEQGLPYFLKFKKRFPDVKSLADAEEDEVLRLWQGLGYYARARNLHAAAKYISEELKGIFPVSYPGIRKLKGVGDYTAAAIASFAYHLPYAVVDGNVFRVLSRCFGIKTPVDTTKGKQQFKALAEKLISKKNPAAYNQAIMDFGAVQCVPVNPACGKCPIKKKCFALKNDLVETLPVKSKKIQLKIRYFHYLVINEGEHIYLNKRSEKDIWRNLYEFPMIESERILSGKEIAKTKQWKVLFNGSNITRLEPAGVFRQTLSHRKILAAFYEANLKGKLNSASSLIRVRMNSVDEYALPGVIREFLTQRSS